MPTLTDPRDLLLHELKDMYYAEQQLLTRTLPTLAQEASDKELTKGFQQHARETKRQVANLEKAFKTLGERPQAEQCPGMDGLKEEHDRFVQEERPGPKLLDVFLTGSAARTEHYEIAAYSGMIALARALGERECVKLLDENLKQEKETLRKIEAIGKRLGKEAASARASA